MFWARWNDYTIQHHLNRIHKFDCSCDENYFAGGGINTRFGSGVNTAANRRDLHELNRRVNQMLRGIGVRYNHHQGLWNTLPLHSSTHENLFDSYSSESPVRACSTPQQHVPSVSGSRSSANYDPHTQEIINYLNDHSFNSELCCSSAGGSTQRLGTYQAAEPDPLKYQQPQLQQSNSDGPIHKPWAFNLHSDCFVPSPEFEASTSASHHFKPKQLTTSTSSWEATTAHSSCGAAEYASGLKPFLVSP